jgi:uncharacterized small protein (TIGR04563 family)
MDEQLDLQPQLPVLRSLQGQDQPLDQNSISGHLRFHGKHNVSQKRKVTLYFNAAMLAETQKEAIRQDRSVSWIIQAAWRIARDEVRRIPASGLAIVPHADIHGDSPVVGLQPSRDARTQA